MFNREVAEKAQQRLERAVHNYNDAQKRLTAAAESLHELRESSGHTVIRDVEAFIASIADHPPRFDKEIAGFRHSFEDFTEAARSAREQFESVTTSSSAGVAAGVAAGAATALLGPSAAMAVATTFGTASTGTAISALSGAAATKAALAWLGGGAVAAGGGGMAGGTALLALAGPVGWTLAGAAVVGGAFVFSKKNLEHAEQANDRALRVEYAQRPIDVAIAFIARLAGLTARHIDGLRDLLAMAGSLPRSYRDFDEAQLELVGAIVNHVHALSQLLKRNAGEYMALHEALEANSITVLEMLTFPEEQEREMRRKHAEAKAAFDKYVADIDALAA